MTISASAVAVARLRGDGPLRHKKRLLLLSAASFALASGASGAFAQSLPNFGAAPGTAVVQDANKNVGINLGNGLYQGTETTIINGGNGLVGATQSVIVNSDNGEIYVDRSFVVDANNGVIGTATDPVTNSFIFNAPNATISGDNNFLANGSSAIGDNNTAFNGGTVTGDNNFVVGGTASGANTIAIGKGSTTSADDTIAMGSGAQATAANAVALGNSASAQGQNDVALGSGSLANGATGTSSVVINGQTYSFAGTSPVGTVSVGSAGSERTITNVAAGSVSATSTDAVNGSQLYATNQAVDALATSIATGDPNSVKYDDPTKSSITLGGTTSTDGGATGGTKITNVSQGTLSSTSTDAVNGSQLYTTNQNVTNVSNQVTNLTNSVTNGTIGPVQTTGNANELALVAPGGSGSSPGAAQTLTNVAAGEVSSTSTDAVNGSQLNATNQAVSTLASNAVQYDDSTKSSITLGGTTSTDGGVTGGTTITNVSQGALSSTSTDAVNGSQLYTTNQNVANVSNQVTNLSQDVTNLGATVNNISQDVTNLNNGTAGIVRQVGGAPGSGDITVGAETGGTVVNMSGTDGDRTVTGVAAGTLSSTSTDAVNGSQLYATGSTVATILGGGATYNSTTGEVTNPSYVINGNTYNNVGDALQAAASSGTDDLAVHYVADANGNPTNQVALTGDGSGAAVSITNVAAGSVAAGSTDAVNGGQLHDLGQSLADGMGGNSTYNSSTGTVTTSLNYGGNTYNSVQGALTNIDNSINGGAGIKYFHTNSTEADSSATGDNSTAIGPLAVATATDSIAIGNGAVASNAGSVALGAGSTTDAVHDGQKGFGSATVAGSSATSSVSVGSSGKERQIQNVAAGVVSSTSTDAVNGSQLNSVIGGVNNVGTSTASALGGGSQYDPTTGLISAPSYTVQGNTYNNAGDAFSAIDGALSHQGAQLNWLTKYANSNFKRLDGAIAGMTALATLEFDPTPGKFSVAGGWGFYESQHAFAGGVAYTFNDRLQVNGRGWYSPSSMTGGGGIGVRYSFP